MVARSQQSTTPKSKSREGDFRDEYFAMSGVLGCAPSFLRDLHQSPFAEDRTTWNTLVQQFNAHRRQARMEARRLRAGRMDTRVRIGAIFLMAWFMVLVSDAAGRPSSALSWGEGVTGLVAALLCFWVAARAEARPLPVVEQTENPWEEPGE